MPSTRLARILSPLAILAALIPSLLQAELSRRPTDADGTPTDVRIQFALLNLENLSGSEQSFTANIAYAARWMDSRLRHSGPSARTVPLSDIWHPRVQIVNRQNIQETYPDEARISPDGEVTIVQRVWGQFSQPLHLTNFPFDEQTLYFRIVGTGHEEGAIRFVRDPDYPSSIAEDLSIPDWKIRSWSAKPMELPLVGTDHSLPGYSLELNVQRSRGYHLVKVILPLVMIVCMSWVVFWIDPATTNPRISVSVTAMLTLIAYRFAVGASLPRIAYLTRMDWFILGSTFLVFISLVEVVVTTVLHEKEQHRMTARRINVWMRVICPLLFLTIAAKSLFW